MKRTLVVLLLSLLSSAVIAQPDKRQPGHVPPPTRYTLNFESQRGEAFSVFIDGDLVNRMPQSRVMVNAISDQTHEVVVVLKRPAEKAAVMQLRPGEPNVVVNVNYDQRLEQLLLYTPSHNRAENYAEERHHPRHDNSHGNNSTVIVVPPESPVAQPEVRVATDDEVASMIARMKAQAFDSDRLALGKVIVASSTLTAIQISRLAATLDYSNSQVELLKYAYHYCVDPLNYYKTTDILTFSNDKKKVLDYIATQR